MPDKIPIKPHQHCLFCYLLRSDDQQPPLITLQHLRSEHSEFSIQSLEGYHALIDTLIINDHFTFTPQLENRLHPPKDPVTFNSVLEPIMPRILAQVNSILSAKNPREQETTACQIEDFMHKYFAGMENRLPPESECEHIVLNDFGYYEKEFLNNHIMIYIPKTRFVGTGEILPGYWIDKYPVTNSKFSKIFKTKKFTSSKRNHPVANVEWAEVQEYCERVQLRPVNEIEWEQAATGGDGRWYPWGGAFDADKCNTYESQVNDSCAVTAHPAGASSYGVMDMLGNVWEWCLPSTNSNLSWLVLRGGSWNNPSSSVSCSVRLKTPPTAKNQNVGFRCAKNATK